MHNYLVVIIAIFKQHGLISSTDAEKLAEKLEGATIPDSYEETQELVAKIYKDLDIKTK